MYNITAEGSTPLRSPFSFNNTIFSTGWVGQNENVKITFCVAM